MTRFDSLAVAAGLMTLVSASGCGDLEDPVLLSCDVEYDGGVVQSLEIDVGTSNVFPDDVHPDSVFLLMWSEPLQLDSAVAAIDLEDAADQSQPVTVTQRLSDLTVTPDAPMELQQNHTLVVNRGIDDEADNTTDDDVNITFYVDMP